MHQWFPCMLFKGAAEAPQATLHTFLAGHLSPRESELVYSRFDFLMLPGCA